MKSYLCRAAAISFVFVYGCSGPANGPDVNIDPEADITISETIAVKSTTHIYPEETIIKATIAPKSGMRAFSSKILLLSDSGKVYASETAFPQLKLVNSGPLSDIAGFYLSDNSSGYLARDAQGKVTAYLDKVDPSFGPVAISGLGENVTFCENQLRAPGRITLVSDGSTRTWEISETAGAETLAFKAIDGGDTLCGTGNDFSLSITDPFPTMMAEKTPEDITAQLENSYNFWIGLFNGKVALTHKDITKSVTIEEGLSIAGIRSPQWIFTTSQPLGNTFNQGLTLIRGDGENRIVMIANDYLAKSVFDGFNSP